MAPRKSPLSNRGTNVLGSRIRQGRESLKPPLTQNDLAAKMGVLGVDVDRPTVTRIEAGKRYLRDYEIVVIAKVLKVSVAWLFGE
jgi:HTH-type transcriptional regulator, cell division transcriptional repressor